MRYSDLASWLHKRLKVHLVVAPQEEVCPPGSWGVRGLDYGPMHGAVNWKRRTLFWPRKVNQVHAYPSRGAFLHELSHIVASCRLPALTDEVTSAMLAFEFRMAKELGWLPAWEDWMDSFILENREWSQLDPREHKQALLRSYRSYEEAGLFARNGRVAQEVPVWPHQKWNPRRAARLDKGVAVLFV